MAIFRRETESPSPAASGGSSESPQHTARRRLTHIAPGTRLKGEVTGATELLVEGEIEGEVRVDSNVEVGSEGVVQGPIAAQVVRVSGRVVGNVQAGDRVEVRPSGSLEGDIAAPRVIIAEGAFFKGRVDMKGDKNREGNRPKGSAEPSNKAAEPSNKKAQGEG
ncbi:MAG TPA: polymer-forming cytoskeletal protein [Thermoanaerobaculia bacterium]